ncbi:sugar ABC transporter ATP-binding protein [Brevibacillus dissolubilis]|uniref:sugar ABC transporter ATP-binding protein n=1 Tax=Brevibacillus dissolubilis TaxID=1844116 RepID=UPI00111799BC|nr:sugar ABC transporter ATP-binding protein [Brevibacillus dissolubilis]
MATLQMRQIQKQFSGVPALRSVDLEVKAGEVHALLGANGAGKSTLMKILTGAYTSDSGEIIIDGQKAAIQTPQDAKAHGIQCVYQEVDTALVPYLSVAENILMERHVTKGKGFLNWSKLYAEAEELVKRLGFALSVRQKVEELTLSEKQLVLIARAIAQDAKYIIFDEPTAPLSTTECDLLFERIAHLKQAGVGIIYISHRLPEIFQICDRITVMRDGQKVATMTTAESNIDEVITHMLGKTFSEEFPKLDVPIGDTLLEVQDLTRGRKVRGVDLTVRAGEIVGVVGLVGAGKTELARLLFGADTAEAGKVTLRGNKVNLASPKHVVDNGIVLVPEERRKEGIVVDESVKNNLTLATLRKWTNFGFIRRRVEESAAQDLVQRLGVKTANLTQSIGHLSGGNQQKVVIGKWLNTESDIFLFDEPTKGVDIGAKSDIYKLIGKLAEEQKGILYFSCEFQEVLGIADRILVMCDGRIVKELSRAEATQELIMYYASGGQAHDEQKLERTGS